MFTRRQAFQMFGAAALAGRLRAEESAKALTQRALGRTGRWVVPFGLGGQASLQFPVAEVDASENVVRAIELGVNYLDTANAYGASQRLYGQAIWKLKITPGHPEHDAALRERLYIASKTGRRYALNKPNPRDVTAIDELKTSLTVMFGDGKGWIPDGAYLDCFQIHNLTSTQQVDQIYENLDRRWDRSVDRLGALAGLLDYRDGTDYTGLNPERKHYIRHIGITGHQSSPVLMNALQRDELNIIDTMLVALNANDRRYQSHQYNAIPLARARGLGIIAMKVFSAGGIYTGMGRQPNNPSELILSVGYPGGVDSSDLIRYPLSVPGVAVVIAGIGKIDRDRPEQDQLVANIAASQMESTAASEKQRIEDAVAARHGASTNYFQDRARGVVQPPAPRIERDGDRVKIRWTTAFADAQPIRSYNIVWGEHTILSVPFRPQLTTAPHEISLPVDQFGGGPFQVVASEQYPKDY